MDRLRGIHFDAGTGGKLKQGNGVRAIADGEVVAYRLNSAYPELTYPTTPPRYALYSTGFVLIRHRLVLPREPKSAESPAGTGGAQAPQNDQRPADEVLEFYSLYMHQLDWKGYQDAQTESSSGSAPPIHPPPFWQGDRHFRVGAKAKDKLSVPTPDPVNTSQNAATPRTGINIRDRASGSVIGLLPRDGELTIVGGATKGWAQIATITKGTPVAAGAGGVANPSAATGWVYLDELDAVIDPKPLDAVVVLDKPFPVKAGDVVGYLGEYQNSTEASLLPPKREFPLLHVEVFTGAQINDFINKSKERAKKLPDKPLLLIQQGAKLVKPADPQSNTGLAGLTLALATGKRGDPGKGFWAKVQPTKLAAQPSTHGHGHNHNHPARGTPVGDPLWVERTKYAGKVAGATVPTWATFPLQLANAQAPAVGYQEVISRAQLDQGREIGRATDDTGTQWWSVTAGDEEGRSIARWVCEKNHPDTLWESPWAWPGFDMVDTTSVPLLDMYRRCLFETKRLIEGDDEKEFSTIAATVNAGQFIGKLEKAAKRQGSGKGNVVPADLRKALTVPWLAEAISHVIFRYESEWGGDMSKWEKFLPLMGALGKPAWTTEMERIKKLQWWDKVKAVKGFPADPDVWHIHPIGLVGNFYIEADCYEFQTSEAIFKVSKRAFQLILSSEGYGPKPYVPGGDQSSGVTVGYGYDLGQQTTATIETDLNGIFTPDQIERLVQASGKHGDTARKLIPSLADITVSPDMAMRLAVVMKSRFAQQTVDAFPGVTSLHPHCQGALLSLVINRGPGMKDKPGQKTRENMRAIRGDMETRSYADIPVQLRDMKKLWDPSMQRGLLIRREQEAILFSDGLDNSTTR